MVFARMKNINLTDHIKQQAREDARKGAENWLGATHNEHEAIYQAEYNREMAKIISEENPEIVLEALREMGLD